MTSKNSASGESPDQTLDSFVEQIEELQSPYDVRTVQDIVRDAVLANLRTAEIAYLEEVIQDRTGLKPKTVAAMIKEARNFHESHGYLNTLREVAKAYLRCLAEAYQKVVWVGGSLFYYQSGTLTGEPQTGDVDASDPETDHFQKATADEVEKHLLEEFDDLPLVHTRSKRQEIVQQVAARLTEEAFFLDARPGVNVTNGFVGWDEANGLVLLPHDPAHKSRMKLEARFDPEASFDWLAAMLAKTLQDQSKLDTLQEVAGAVIFNIRPEQDEARRLIFFAGPKSSGKSTLLNMLEGLMPSSAVASVPPSEWGKEYYRARLEGVSLNIVTELGGEMRIAGEHVKKIGSCEPVSARHPHGRPFTFRPTAWHLFATNELPRIIDKTDAFERRLLCLNFDRSLRGDEVDGNFADRLRENASAVINWAAVGAARLQENGRFTLPSDHALTASRMQHGDEDHGAILAQARVEAAPGGRVTTVEIRQALRELAVDLGHDPDVVNDGTIKRFVGGVTRRYGVTRHKSTGAPFYRGIRLIRQNRFGPGRNDGTESDLAQI